MIEEIKKGYEEIEELKASLEIKSRAYCEDKNIPLKDRWEFFEELGLGDHDSDYLDFEDFGIDIYQDMGYETNKYETVDLVSKANLYQTLTSTKESEVNSWEMKSWEKLHDNGGQEFVDKMKERCISNWTKSCEFDW